MLRAFTEAEHGRVSAERDSGIRRRRLVEDQFLHELSVCPKHGQSERVRFDQHAELPDTKFPFACEFTHAQPPGLGE